MFKKILTIAVATFGLTTITFAENTSKDAGAKQKQPNILLIMAEDMSARVGYAGDKVANTPNIDALAGEGLSYMRTYTAAGVCAPSRTAHIFGMHQQTMGGHQMRAKFYKYNVVPPANVKAYPEYLRALGYYTSNNSKTDYQVGDPASIWDDNGNKAHWRNRPAGKPFFHMVTFNVTHESKTWAADSKPEPGMIDQAVKTVIRGAANNAKLFAKQKQSTKPSDVIVPPYLPDLPAVRADLARHYNNIEMMDSQVGRLLKQLKDDGLLDNTIIIWTTDHGDGLPRAKRTVYESGVHVPMTIRFPDGHRAGEKTNELVSFIDMGPTLITAAGGKVPENMQGKIFFGKKRSKERTYIHAAGDRHDEIADRVRSVRNDQFKYIRNYNPSVALYQHMWYRDIQLTMRTLWQEHAAGRLNADQDRYFQPRDAEELYDLKTDPYELKNLASDPAFKDQLAELRGEMDRFQKQYFDYGTIPEDKMIEQMWPGGKQPVTEDPMITVMPCGKARIYAADNASIVYSLDKGKTWLLYSQPFDVSDVKRFQVKAIRYGYKESQIVTYKGR